MAKKSKDEEAAEPSAARESSTEAGKKREVGLAQIGQTNDSKERVPSHPHRTAVAKKPRERRGGGGGKMRVTDKRAKSATVDRSVSDRRKGPTQRKPLRATAKAEQVDFPVVGIGASAGGLESFEQFFAHMPPDTGMAFVIVQHLHPAHENFLPAFIRRFTRMEVSQVEEGVKVQPNCVYVIPPDSYLAILNGTLHLLEPTVVRAARTPIDYFFRSLGEDRHGKSVGIVMSGAGSDGALGLRAIRAEGGMVMVQDPATAQHDGMPQSAIATGVADFVLPVTEIARKLINYVDLATSSYRHDPDSAAQASVLMDKILMRVRKHIDRDFSQYKKAFILDRIEHRMAMNGLHTMEDYLRFLNEHPKEAYSLFKNITIHVTGFFRDPEAFAALRQKALKRIFETGPRDRPVRIWAPGCSTGEEVYSLAMLAHEYKDRLDGMRDFHVFATDIDADAIDFARKGIYPRSISQDVDPARLGKFFSEQDDMLRVTKNLREKLIFAVQNVLEDPPFAKVDLISCRNLLIYLTPEMQQKLVAVFHHALRPGGFLFLGTSESLHEFDEIFSTVDRKWKLFMRADAKWPARWGNPALPFAYYGDRARTGLPSQGTADSLYREAVDRFMLNAYSPAAVIVDERGKILYVHGNTGQYLEPAPDRVFEMNVRTMAREELGPELASALQRATGLGEEIRVDRVRVNTNGAEPAVNLIIKPIIDPASLKGLYLVVFEDVKTGEHTNPPLSKAPLPEPDNRRVKDLEKKLKSTEECLQGTVEKMVTLNQEQQSANEELMCSNEELENSNEQLQSVNQELASVNAELQAKIEELSRAESDMRNLLASVQFAAIFLDGNLRIRRFSPLATALIPVIQTDVGRPVEQVVPNLKYDGLAEDCRQVLRTLVPVEKEVQSGSNTRYAMRILPYRTIHNVIDGVVITFTDVTRFRKWSPDGGEN